MAKHKKFILKTLQEKAHIMKDIKPKYMMATTAIHLLGDISEDAPELCRVFQEDDDNYYGNWVLGIGFMNVRFPKETTKDLNGFDIRVWNGRKIALGGLVSTINVEN